MLACLWDLRYQHVVCLFTVVDLSQADFLSGQKGLIIRQMSPILTENFDMVI